MEREKINTQKRQKVKNFIKKSVGLGLFVSMLPQAFSGYIFKDNNNEEILNINSNTKDVVAPAFIATGNVALARDGDGEIATITKHNRVWTITRDVDGEIASLSDGLITKTITRDVNGELTGITVT